MIYPGKYNKYAIFVNCTIACCSTLYCCAMKHRRKYQDYVVLADAEPIKGTIVESNENKV